MHKKRIDAKAEILERRQHVLDDPEAVELVGVIDESVLRRTVGGKDVMGDQLRALLDAAERPNITVQVIPTSLGAHPAQTNPYDLLEFRKIPAAVHLPQHEDHGFVTAEDRVQDYQRLTRLLCSEAQPPEESLRMITAAAERMGSTVGRQC